MQILSLCGRRTVAMEPPQRTNTTRPMFSQHLPPHGLQPQHRPSPRRICPGCIARSHVAPISRHPKWSGASRSQPWGRAAVVVRIPQQPHSPGSGTGKGHPSLAGGWRGDGCLDKGRHKERARTATGVLTQAPKPPLPGRRFTPSPAPLQFRAEAKGQCPAEPEKSRSPATTQPGRWHQALPAWRT